MDKRAIRAICLRYGFELANKPAIPCLASRIAYCEPVTVEKLRQVESAEDFLLGIGPQGGVIERNAADDALVVDQDIPQCGCNNFLEE
jgi:PP-loop superfamily ATP-utilizing enzyme